MANESDILKYVTAGCVGLALAGVIIAGQRILRATQLEGLSAAAGLGSTSMRRAEMRERALRRSKLFGILLSWLRLLSAFTSQMNLEVLRHYVRTPYAQAGYPGGLDDDEVVSLALLLGLFLMVFLGFSLGVLVGPGWAIFGLMGLPLGLLMVVTQLKNKAATR